jgi:hypothetical protein
MGRILFIYGKYEKPPPTAPDAHAEGHPRDEPATPVPLWQWSSKSGLSQGYIRHSACHIPCLPRLIG